MWRQLLYVLEFLGVPVRFGCGMKYKTTLIDDTDSPYTIDANEHVIVCDTSSGNISVSLGQVASLGIGTSYKIVNRASGAYNVTVTAYSGDDIDETTSITLYAGESVEIIADGSTSWEIW